MPRGFVAVDIQLRFAVGGPRIRLPLGPSSGEDRGPTVDSEPCAEQARAGRLDHWTLTVTVAVRPPYDA